MAKATSTEKGAAARMRAARGPRGADDATPRDEMPLAVDDAADDDVVDGAVVEDAASEDAGAAGLAPQGSQAVARTGGVPASLAGNSFTRFIAESYLELRKVTWPTPRQAWNLTLVVIAMSAFIAVVLGVADFGLARALTWLVSLR